VILLLVVVAICQTRFSPVFHTVWS